MKQFRVTNITSGTLELKAYKTVLGPCESRVFIGVPEDEIMWKLGSRNITLELISEPELVKKPVTEPVTVIKSKDEPKKKSE